jgi:5-methylcytosine-specific restriction protein A
MNEGYSSFYDVDDAIIRVERAKARVLRKSRWWQRKISSGCCYYCGQNVGQMELTMDHLIPLSRGGRSTKDNLVPCCKPCNNTKKNGLPAHWQLEENMK